MKFLYNLIVMNKFDDFVKYSILFLYYKSLFSNKQGEYLRLYLEENTSFSEIAEEFSVSRQAVFDNIKRGFKQLDVYESKLKIFEKELYLKKSLQDLQNDFTIEKLNMLLEELDYNEE